MDRSEQYARHNLNRMAFSATVHCLAGCSIGEVLGMALGSAMDLSDPATIALSVALAFLFGYSLTMAPLLSGGMTFGTATRLALASDTVTIAVMEIVDNTVMLVIPGAMEAGPAEPLFWGSLMTSLAIAGIAAFPVSRWLISRGRGHAVVQGHHAPGHGENHDGPVA
ncbi:MAG: DUF4396 domain-containing protein [Deltaproteobacteria bacterium]